MTTVDQILRDHASQIDVPNPDGRVWLARGPNGWRVFGLYGLTWIYDRVNQKWAVAAKTSVAELQSKRFAYDDLVEAFEVGKGETARQQQERVREAARGEYEDRIFNASN